MVTKKFVRQDSMRFLKLGKKQKKKQVWRKPKGRDSKMRLKRKSYPDSPTVGHKSSKEKSRKIQGLTLRIVHNLKELSSLDNKSFALLAKVGLKKKLEIIRYAREHKIKIDNVRGT